MNFKDIYKEANDEIKGNREILNRPVKKKNTYKSTSKIIYAFGSAAAAAILLFGVVHIPDFHEKAIDERVQSEDIPTLSSLNTEAIDEEKATKAYGGEASFSEIDAKETEKVKKSTPTTPKSESTYGENPTVRENSAEADRSFDDEAEIFGASSYASEKKTAEAGNESPAAVSEDYAPAALSLDEADIENGNSGAEGTEKDGDNTDVGTASLRTSGSGTASLERKSLSREEFFELSGLNEENLSLNGFEVFFSGEAEGMYSPSGEAYFYSATFYLSSENSHMSVTVSKSDGVKSESIDIYGDEVYASADNETLSVYISALNVPSDTVSEYLKSIIG